MYAELKQKKCSICKKLHNSNCYYCKECKKEWRKKYDSENREKLRAYDFKRGLKRYYRISLDEYQKLFDIQKGCCAICGRHQEELTRSLAIDHCHKTKTIRGLLCDNCNPGIGYFKESVELLIKAIEYLGKFKN